MSGKEIICPYCSGVCQVRDLFCKHCGRNLSGIKENHGQDNINIKVKYCPMCGQYCEHNQNFCSACGFSFMSGQNRYEETKLLNKPALFIVFAAAAFGFLVYFVMKIIGSIPDEQIKPDIIQEEAYSMIKAKNCHDEAVKDTASRIFKENDYYYKYIDPATISDGSLKFPSMDTYNPQTDRYYCRGTIYVIAAPKGFAPAVSEEGNHYFDEINGINNDGESVKRTDKKYTRYLCEINYASQISQNQVYVTATACGNGLDFNNKGKFAYMLIPKKIKTDEPQTNLPDDTETENEIRIEKEDILNNQNIHDKKELSENTETETDFAPL